MQDFLENKVLENMNKLMNDNSIQGYYYEIMYQIFFGILKLMIF